MTEDIATAMLTLRPRNGLNLDATSGAIHPPHGVGECDGDVPNWNELELPGQRHVVVSGAALGTSRADGFTVSPRDDFGDDTHRIARAACAYRMVNEALDAMDFVE